MRLAVFALLLVAAAPAAAQPCEAVPIWRAGKHVGDVCRAEAASKGLTVVELGDAWTPPILDGTAYQPTYLLLAAERFAAATSESLASRDRYLELFGIEPTLRIVRARLADDVRHRCHEAIDDSALEASPRLDEDPVPYALARISHARELRRELERERVAADLDDLDALAETDAPHAHAVATLEASEQQLAAVRAVQAHLACDGLFLTAPIEGAFTWQTTTALATFQRGQMILPTGALDLATRDALTRGSRERDFRTALRVLRERVRAATGLIEDGTAGSGPLLVLDRRLDADETLIVRGHLPLPDAAPDLISPATEAAARALGWTDPAATRAFLDALYSRETRTTSVAVPLPPLPPYHGPAMQLSVEIDRGDVWRDPAPRAHEAGRRPALILYATADNRRIALVRWPTTIGGWQDQQRDEGVLRQWKESPAGPRLWRDLYVMPRWLPPLSTPDEELVRRTDTGAILAREVFGPSYRGAFGLVAFVHHDRNFEDEGILTHGTGNLASVARGASHGCHRVLGLMSLRLADFVLAHHVVVRRGEQPTAYHRVVHADDLTFPVEIDTLGERLELVPPIPVLVLPGRVHR